MHEGRPGQHVLTRTDADHRPCQGTIRETEALPDFGQGRALGKTRKTKTHLGSSPRDDSVAALLDVANVDVNAVDCAGQQEAPLTLEVPGGGHRESYDIPRP